VSFGLALGGGAARGHAHVGVLSALEAAGLRPSHLAGTSAGAIVAGLYAFGVGVDEIESAAGEFTWRDVAGISLKRTGLLSNRELGDICEDLLGPVDLRDAAIPLAVVTTDITNGERVVFTDGPLSRVVRASAAVPGVFEPVEIGDRQLVDGGLVENVPVAALRELGAATVVAVTLDTGLDFQTPRSLVPILINAFQIAVSTASEAYIRDAADVVIRPDLRHFTHWNTKDGAAIRREGQRAGEAAVEAIRTAQR